MPITIHPQPFTTPSLAAPSSKSHTLRAILFASLASGTSTIKHPLLSPDTQAMIDACQAVGATIKHHGDHLTIIGTGGQLKPPTAPINVGNSGITLRFISAIASLLDKPVFITGDHSIQTNRPISALCQAIQPHNVKIDYQATKNYAPFTLTGPLQPGNFTIDGQDSQPVSALLIACALLPGASHIQVNNPGEQPWLDLTLYWFDKLNIAYRRRGYDDFWLEGHTRLQAFNMTIPGDVSSALFPACAALLSQSNTCIHNLDWHDPQGDKLAFDYLQQMGAQFNYDDTQHSLSILPTPTLQAIDCDLNDCIDALPMLAVVCCFADGTSRLSNAAIARHKESDRLSAITIELQKMGANIEQTPDSLIIHGPTLLHGATLDAHNDHRLAMALTIAAHNANTPSTLAGHQWVNKSYPGFYQALASNTTGQAGHLE